MSSVERVCSRPGCTNSNTSQCSGCGEEFYCSKECQKLHWPEHKSKCKKAQLEGITSFDSLTVKQLKTVFTNKAAELDNKKRDKLLKKMEKIAEKPDLVRFVSQHVQLSEVEKLLLAPKPKPEDKIKAAEEAMARQGGKKIKFDGFATPSADQMKQQAAMMRSNPNLVRQSNPAFANYTDEQIRQIAEQLEQTASNPDALKEVERMFKMSSDDRGILQKVQEGLTGARPIDGAWIDDIVDTIRNKPEVFKTLFRSGASRAGADAGVSPDQIEGFIDMASKMDRWLLRMIAYGLWYISLMIKPMTDLYKTLDSYTFGASRYIFLALFALIMYYVSMATIYVLRIVFTQLYRVGYYLYATVNNLPVQEAASTAARSAVQDAAKAAGESTILNAAASAAGKVAADEFEF